MGTVLEYRTATQVSVGVEGQAVAAEMEFNNHSSQNPNYTSDTMLMKEEISYNLFHSDDKYILAFLLGILYLKFS